VLLHKIMPPFYGYQLDVRVHIGRNFMAFSKKRHCFIAGKYEGWHLKILNTRPQSRYFVIVNTGFDGGRAF